MILGAWEEDLEDELSRHLPPDRREAWGPSDMSSAIHLSKSPDNWQFCTMRIQQ